MSTTGAFRMRRRLLAPLAGAGMVLVGVLLTSTAFACVASQSLTVTPKQSETGNTIDIVGGGWMGTFDSDTEVQIRWSGGEGVLATAAPGSEGTWSAEVTVPDIEPGVYVVNARQERPDGQLLYSASQVFEVTASGVGAPGAGNEQGAASGGGGLEAEGSAVPLGAWLIGLAALVVLGAAALFGAHANRVRQAEADARGSEPSPATPGRAQSDQDVGQDDQEHDRQAPPVYSRGN